MKAKDLSAILVEKGLKVTPQRTAVLDAILTLKNHPTAENIIDHIRISYPNISSATVYKVLDAFISYGIIRRVKTERDVMRYDAVMESHHHLYCSESDRIEDYSDDELTQLLAEHFRKKKIPGFVIEDLKLQVIGRFTKVKK